MDSESTITAWDPPRSFSAGGSQMDPSGPTMATEWTVEAKSGGTCIVRVVHSWFAETDEWDSQFESTELGWGAFFRDLALYLVHFFGQPSATFQLMGFSTDSQDATWAKLSQALGFERQGIGEKAESPAGAPSLSGEIKHTVAGEHPETLMLINRPAPGVAHFFAMPMGGMVCLSIRVFLFGEAATQTVAREEAVWTEWLAQHFPMPAHG